MALGLGLAACQKGLSVGFTTAASLVHELIETRDKRRLLNLQKKLARLKLLIIDELGFFLRRLCLPNAVKHWSLRSVQVKLIKMGGRLVRHSRRLIFQLSEVSVPRRLFQGVLDRIGRLSPAPS